MSTSTRSCGGKHILVVRIERPHAIQVLVFWLFIQFWLITLKVGHLRIIKQRLGLSGWVSSWHLLHFGSFFNIRRWLSDFKIILQPQLDYLPDCGCFKKVFERVLHHLIDELSFSHVELLLLLPYLLHKSKIDFKEDGASESYCFLEQSYLASPFLWR